MLEVNSFFDKCYLALSLSLSLSLTRIKKNAIMCSWWGGGWSGEGGGISVKIEGVNLEGMVSKSEGVYILKQGEVVGREYSCYILNRW